MSNINEQNKVVLVALYRYLNFPIRIMHSVLENTEGIEPHTIFYKNYDTNVFELPTDIEEKLFIKQIIDLKPKLVGISVLSPYFFIAKRLTKLIHENSSALVVWGGVHPTISPEMCIKEADIICVGEGEGAITDLVTCLRDGKDYQNVENLWINNDGHIIKNPMRPLVQDLDSLPFPSYGKNTFCFINSNRMTRKDNMFLDKHVYIQSSRGCPFVCSYCVNSLLRPLFKGLGPYTRRRSVKSVIREIKENLELSGNSKDRIFFIDEVFGTDISWMNEFESTYKKEIGLPFIVEYNPIFINSTVLEKLVSAGVHTIIIGIQTGSDNIRNNIFCRPGKNKEIISTANEIAKYGIEIRYDLIVDNPYDTEDTLKEAVSVLLQLPKPLYFNLYSLQYFPGYPLTQRVIEDEHVKEEDISVESLMERTTKNWAFVPQLFPYINKQVLQNVIWLIVWGHASDRMVKYAIFNKSRGAKFCLTLMNIKAVVWGKIFRFVLKHGWILYLRNGFRHILKGNFKVLYYKIVSLIRRFRRSTKCIT